MQWQPLHLVVIFFLQNLLVFIYQNIFQFCWQKELKNTKMFCPLWVNQLLLKQPHLHPHTLLSFAIEPRHPFSDGDELVQGLFWAYSERYFHILFWYTFCPVSTLKWSAECSDNTRIIQKQKGDVGEIKQFLSTSKMKTDYLLPRTFFPHQLDAVHPHLPEGCS